MHTVSQLLNNKEHWNENDSIQQRIERVHTITQCTTVLEAARMMNEHRVGALIVKDTFGDIVGIISERDILTRVVAAEKSPSSTTVDDVMTKQLISCKLDTTLAQARHLMTKQRIRHVPVIDNGVLEGMISIGDLNAATNNDLNIEVKAMRDYITNG